MKATYLLSVFFILFSIQSGAAQSFELMTGTKRIFFDVKYIKIVEGHKNFSLLSRTRATAEYDEQKTDLFTGTYLNYSIKAGFGGTVAGRIASTGSGFDLGVHYFTLKPTPNSWPISFLRSKLVTSSF
ncbi:MAG: hypothetical protein IPL49_09195 [Saprospirales bacterium]|nr:hypothetical protein [Saprospirales bacterium]MBK8491048.1 hypothetical protein [Saprospirales bacterium]